VAGDYHVAALLVVVNVWNVIARREGDSTIVLILPYPDLMDSFPHQVRDRASAGTTFIF
jgi:hypothetical protein